MSHESRQFTIIQKEWLFNCRTWQSIKQRLFAADEHPSEFYHIWLMEHELSDSCDWMGVSFSLRLEAVRRWTEVISSEIRTKRMKVLSSSLMAPARKEGAFSPSSREANYRKVLSRCVCCLWVLFQQAGNSCKNITVKGSVFDCWVWSGIYQNSFSLFLTLFLIRENDIGTFMAISHIS